MTTTEKTTEKKPATEQQKEIKRMIKMLKAAASKSEVGALQCHEVASLLQYIKPIFEQQPMLVEVQTPVSICGDIHGQLYDLVRLFDKNGWPTQMTYLFLGDYVDRGPNSVDTICLLFALKCRHPEKLYLLRGNHETKAVNDVYGFKIELQRRYPPGAGPDGKPFDFGTELWRFFNRVFDFMPLAALVCDGEGQILCMHGGLSPDLTNLNQIRELKRPLSKFPEKGLEIDLLWADPDKEAKGFVQSPRGISYLFGPDAVVDKCDELRVDMIARAHQVVPEGYEMFAGGQLVTLFSAPDYCNQFENHAGLLFVDLELKCKLRQLPSKTKKQKEKEKGGEKSPVTSKK